jgi:predicted dehydrogenase
MTKKYRIGIVGLTHDHVWGNLEFLATMGNGQLAAVADPHQELLDRVTKQYGCEAYHDYKEMIERESLDVVGVFSDNAQGPEVGVWAAQHGLHVLIEKPMATTLAGAESLIAATQAAGVRLLVNWPVVWRPQVQAALDLVSRGDIGQVWQLTHRAAHGGPDVECSPYFREWILDPQRNGAGALIDLCCYGINMAQVVLGRPERVTATVGQWHEPALPAEDSAFVVMSYPRAMATAEGVWGQIGHPTTGYLATIWGTRGSVALGPGRGGRLWITTAEQPESLELTPPTPVPHMANGFAHFLWALETGNELYPLCRPAVCCQTQEVLDAAIRSAREGVNVTLPSRKSETPCLADCRRN